MKFFHRVIKYDFHSIFSDIKYCLKFSQFHIQKQKLLWAIHFLHVVSNILGSQNDFPVCFLIINKDILHVLNVCGSVV